MSARTPFSGPVKAAVFGFLSLCGVAAAVALSQRMSLIDTAVTRRAIGLVVGVMALVTGNLLPKTRPLRMFGVNSANAIASERLAGWTLALAGIVYIALFAFAPLDQARLFSSMIGIGAMAVIAANWMRLALRASVSCTQATENVTGSERDRSKGKLMAYLLFAFFWIFATASVVFLSDHLPWVRELALWMTVGFGFLYAALTAVLDWKPSTR